MKNPSPTRRPCAPGSLAQTAISRRDFLRSLGPLALGSGLVASRVMGVGGSAGANERICIGIIGVGNQGNQHLGVLLSLPDTQVVAVCDPVRGKREAARQRVQTAYSAAHGQAYRGCVAVADFREMVQLPGLDAVFVASPEHWHALHGLAVLRAGLDLYIEKALTTTIAEGQALLAAARQYGRVVQVGTQQRSSEPFRRACEWVRNGYIGQLVRIRVGDPRGYPGPPVRDLPVPEEINYDLWLGPAPWKPYMPERLQNLQGWMLTYDYTVGFQSGWGQHDIDIAQWGNGTDHTGPVEVEGRATFPADGLNDTAMTWHTDYRYANGVQLSFTSDNENPHGIRFEGTEGWVFVNRERLATQPTSLASVRLKSNDLRLYESNHHHRNFLDSVRTRCEPVCPLTIGHRTNVICNLSDIATRLGRKLQWDPVREQFPNDPQANRMLSRAMRAPWRL